MFSLLTKGDFHIHSTASDGDFTPREVVLAAKERGIDTIAITDHNTTDGIIEAVAAGSQHGVTVIPAIELSTRYKSESIHLLGYFRDVRYNNSTFQETLKLIKTHKFKKARNIIRNFITTKASGEHLSVLEGMDLLRTFGAAVVLAHPVRIDKRYLPEILNIPFDGIEAKCSYNSYNDTSYFVNTALTRFAFYTGGSDFHGNKRKDFMHGLVGDPYLNQTEIQIFLNKSRARVY